MAPAFSPLRTPNCWRALANKKSCNKGCNFFGRARGDRTLDLLVPNQARYQLRYSPRLVNVRRNRTERKQTQTDVNGERIPKIGSSVKQNPAGLFKQAGHRTYGVHLPLPHLNKGKVEIHQPLVVNNVTTIFRHQQCSRSFWRKRIHVTVHLITVRMRI